MMNRSPVRFALAILLATSLLVAACGGQASDGSASDEPAAAPTPAPVAEAEPTPAHDSDAERDTSSEAGTETETGTETDTEIDTDTDAETDAASGSDAIGESAPAEAQTDADDAGQAEEDADASASTADTGADAATTDAATTDAVATDVAATDGVATFVIVPEESEARYSIDEVFISDNNALVTAIGKTTEITGSLTLDYADPTASTFGEFVVDISTLRSDRTRRDRAIRTRWLESASYPLATFQVTEVRGFPTDPAEGEAIDFQLAGDMTVKETTRAVVWDVTATLEGDRLTGTATLATLLEDFNIPVPTIAGILRVTDGIVLTLDFTMQQTEGF